MEMTIEAVLLGIVAFGLGILAHLKYRDRY
jgi:hypothetical protein